LVFCKKITKHQVRQNIRRCDGTLFFKEGKARNAAYPLPSFGKEGGSAEPGVFLSSYNYYNYRHFSSFSVYRILKDKLKIKKDKCLQNYLNLFEFLC